MRRVLLLVLLLAAGCHGERSSGGDPPGPGSGTRPGTWRFKEVAERSGLRWRHAAFNPDGAFDAYDHGCGVAAGDFDGDGHEDVLLLSQCGPAGYFLGRGNGTFRDRSHLLPPLGDGVRVAVTHGDFDGDGRVDFFVTYTRRPCALLRQEPDGSFRDVAAERGVALRGHYSGASFVDVDGDGDLDLVVAGAIRFTEEDVPVPAADGCPPGWRGRPVGELFFTAGSDPTALFINGGAASGWTFTEEAAARGIPPGGPDAGTARGFGDVLVLDYNRDGRPDLLLPEMFHGRTVLLENDGTGRFRDVTAERLPRASFGPPSAGADDFDGDGWPDILMVDMHSDMWMHFDQQFAAVDSGVRYRGPGGPFHGEGDNPDGPLYGNTLWMSLGGGFFREAGPDWGAETFNPWGVLTGDFDNDGDPDVYVPSGMSNPWHYFPDVFLVNLGTRFVQRQSELRLVPPPTGPTDPRVLVRGEPLVHSTRGAAAADFDGDGDLDIVCYAWDSRALLWRNDLPRGRHWISVELAGNAPGDLSGAEVEVVAGGRTQVRWAQASRGYLSQSSPRVHFGLGVVREVESVTVRWPDRSTTRVERPRVDRRLLVRK